MIIHAREADDDVAAVLRSDARTPVVLHSFSSGPALLRAGLDLGHYLSFSGMVTFRNWALDDAVRAVPLERLLIETDGPYLAPVPQPGQAERAGVRPAHGGAAGRRPGYRCGGADRRHDRQCGALFGCRATYWD